MARTVELTYTVLIISKCKQKDMSDGFYCRKIYIGGFFAHILRQQIQAHDQQELYTRQN